MISMDVLTCALAGVVTSSLAALPSVLILRRVRRLERQHQPDRLLDKDTPVPLPKSDDAPPPVPVAMVEPAPSLLRLYNASSGALRLWRVHAQPSDRHG
jgi:hypothetical protein